ncbi:MAG: hypothetical protein ABJO36_03495 [Litorimonas sp.]
MSISEILPTFVAAFAVTIVLGWIKKKVSEYNPVGNPSIAGTIKPDAGLVYFVLIIGILFLIFGALTTILIDGMLVYGPACTVMGAGFVILSIPSLTSIQDINWTEESLSGPSKVKFQVMGISRKELNWSDIVSVGLVKGPYYYVEDKNAHRIYWARSYKEFENFEATLTKNCPTLTLPRYELYPK